MAGKDQGLASFCEDVNVDVAYLLRKACCITDEASEFTSARTHTPTNFALSCSLAF